MEFSREHNPIWQKAGSWAIGLMSVAGLGCLIAAIWLPADRKTLIKWNGCLFLVVADARVYGGYGEAGYDAWTVGDAHYYNTSMSCREQASFEHYTNWWPVGPVWRYWSEENDTQYDYDAPVSAATPITQSWYSGPDNAYYVNMSSPEVWSWR
jgi:hypothetical protein